MAYYRFEAGSGKQAWNILLKQKKRRYLKLYGSGDSYQCIKNWLDPQQNANKPMPTAR